MALSKRFVNMDQDLAKSEMRKEMLPKIKFITEHLQHPRFSSPADLENDLNLPKLMRNKPKKK